MQEDLVRHGGFAGGTGVKSHTFFT